MGDSKTLMKALELLEGLAESSTGMTALELADCITLHRSGVYRYLSAFMRNGYIRKDATDRYHLGNRILELSSQMLRRMPLRETAHPMLVKLSAQTLHTVHLCVLDSFDVVYIDKIESQQTLPLASRIGSRAPAYCTAVGRVLLSRLPVGQAMEFLGSASLPPRTPMTTVDPVRIIEILQLVMHQGYAIEVEESELGVMCIAVPIWEQGGDCIAAISLTGLKRELYGEKETADNLDAVKKAAASISKALGYVDIC